MEKIFEKCIVRDGKILIGGREVQVIRSLVMPVSKAPRQYQDAFAKSGLDPATRVFISGVIVPREVADEAIRQSEIIHDATDPNKQIEGYTELRAALNDIERYHHEFNAMMDDEFNDGVRPPKPIKEGLVDELKVRYPRAAAYIKADSWSNASHHVKYTAGKKAKERIVKGEDFTEAIAEMEKTWSDHTNEHMWN